MQITKEREMYKERLEKLRKKFEKENHIQVETDG